METLTELGQSFLVPELNLANLVKTSKRSPRKIKNFLISEASEERVSVLEGSFVRFPKTFVTHTILDEFGAELRTLLHLLLKTKGRDTPINYTQSGLCTVLGVKPSTLITHREKLKSMGYLLYKKKTSVKSLKTQIKRTIVFHYYPSTIKI